MPMNVHRGFHGKSCALCRGKGVEGGESLLWQRGAPGDRIDVSELGFNP